MKMLARVSILEGKNGTRVLNTAVQIAMHSCPWNSQVISV